MRESFPQTNGQVTVPALNGTATVMRDEYGIPHIYADTPEDLFAAQGFVQ
ncbi:MAG TPA: penicillin acylase family protein, partial [Candidatus Avipropionibacterium avicola]|nr:penicillin acylase family protein [Candidatus Avipropionibacterium avicola]